MFQLSTTTVVLLLFGFYGLTFLMALRIGAKKENVDGYMVANGAIGFGMSAASMTATWIWAASFYAAASSGYKYGLSGALHYGFWGALMILFIYPFGKRFRELAPQAHTLAEIMHARHGRSSQMILAGSNIVGSVISLMVNFTAAGALVAVLSPLSFIHGVLIAGFGVLSYTLWSGFRSSVMTDFGQLMAMILAAVIIIPMIFFTLGGPQLFTEGMPRLNLEQASFFSKTAFLEQGAPFFVAVLAYAIGNQTIAQRLFAVREDLIKPTFITATVGYGAIVIGLGMLGFLALLAGVQPMDGDLNNLIPQMAATYLPPFAVGLLFIMVIGSLSSTADSDLAALSALVMTDIYGKNLARGRPNPTTMLWVGRLTMITATLIGVIFASMKLDILSMLIFVGALWGAIVFPVIASLFWNRVTNTAFTSAVAVAFLMFVVTRFELVSLHGAMALFFELLATLGGGVVIGLMAFGFFGRTAGLALGVVATLVLAPFALGHLRDYAVLLSSLTAYGASAVVCTAVSLLSNERFDFDRIGERVVAFQHSDNNESTPEEKEINACPVSL
ncbi:sodium:solute symporter family protein [Stutzerimonas nitrititolerans]|uniref:sodium:solute symporter family protein n=1 Tax=Stutzerimonas nitrititolerans TaxID=2482751 RepID=UPI00071833E5|nr:sodium:solute symporter family protein [Stutzerimonas nitrititolerans]KRW73877.1 sodium:proline symporter [Pseudomonas sp. TTU2014-066ASC]WAD27996.1 sodium:solute symporter family protein [Pseudomonadaceae bacterium T75]